MNRLRRLCAALVSVALLSGGCAPVRGPRSAVYDTTGTQPPIEILAANPGSAILPVQPGNLQLSSGISLTPAAALSELDLSIPKNFAVTRPAKQISTTLSSYFITGTSDPDKPLSMGGTEIHRQGSSGVFGVLVNLSMGTNTFSFSQDGVTKTATIVRTQAASSSAPITEMRQNSIYPFVQAGVKVGEELLVECVAPSGAAVTATFDGKTVALSQVAQASAGVPAVFRSRILIDGDYDDDVTQKAGKISYTMTYNGATKTYQSTGDVYVAGRSSHIAVRVTGYIGFVYSNTNNLSVFREKLKAGAVDFVADQDNEYCRLSSGGYLPKSMAEIVEGKVSVKNKLDDVSFTSGSQYESYRFSGTRSPAYLTSLSGSAFSLTLYNTSGTPGAGVSGSGLFSDISVTDHGGSVTYTFTLKSAGRLWGYSVSFDGSDTVLRFNYKPSLGSGSRPLEGVTVLVDPGHGGREPGALGFTGDASPNESLINLAHALATRDLLEEKGAKVVMTREDDQTTVSLDDRLKMIEDVQADLFLSIHHNSLREDVDANNVSGMEIYYHTSLSGGFANTMMNRLATNLNRNNRGVYQSYYRVTLMPYAPAILTELGYISNPREFEKSLNRDEIQKAASALVDGVIRALQ